MTRDVSALSHAVPTDGPLAGVRVIEAGQLLAGPFCGQLLGDLGAEVIKIEPPGAGDPMRLWGREKPHGQSLWWPVVARNKKSVVLDLVKLGAGWRIADITWDDKRTLRGIFAKK